LYDESSTTDSDTGKDGRRPRFKRRHIKHELKQGAHDETKSKPLDSVDGVKSSIEDLAEKIAHLTISSQFEAARTRQ